MTPRNTPNLARSIVRPSRVALGAVAAGLLAATFALPGPRRRIRGAGRLARHAAQARLSARIVRKAQLDGWSIDPLTGLPDAAAAARLVAAAVRRARRRGSRLALLHVDIDEFGITNDVYGTDAGDHVLQVCAARLEADMRPGDHVFRLEADQFLLVLESAPNDHVVTRIGERVVDALGRPIMFEGETMMIATSIGIAVSAGGDTDAEELLRLADHAVGKARANGRRVMRF